MFVSIVLVTLYSLYLINLIACVFRPYNYGYDYVTISELLQEEFTIKARCCAKHTRMR